VAEQVPWDANLTSPILKDAVAFSLFSTRSFRFLRCQDLVRNAESEMERVPLNLFGERFQWGTFNLPETINRDFFLVGHGA
jgi:hypothetical protein